MHSFPAALYRATLIYTVLGGCCPSVAATPFPASDQNPLIKIHGLPPPVDAGLPAAGNGQLTLSANISNTLNIEQSGSEYLLIDGENRDLNLIGEYGLSERWALRLFVPFIHYSGGSLDHAIENFHDTFGMNQGDRLQHPRDRLLFLYVRGQEPRVQLNSPSSGVGDLQLAAGRALHDSPESVYSVWTGIKLPTGDSDRLTGSGATDLAFWGAGNWQMSQAFSASMTAGVLLFGSADVLSDLQKDNALFGNAGLHWQIWPNTILKAQLDWHTNFYKNTGLRFLSDVLQLTCGATWLLTADMELDFAVVEDIKTGASPDVNFNINLRFNYR
jgi:hypothetical protein